MKPVAMNHKNNVLLHACVYHKSCFVGYGGGDGGGWDGGDNILLCLLSAEFCMGDNGGCGDVGGIGSDLKRVLQHN